MGIQKFTTLLLGSIVLPLNPRKEWGPRSAVVHLPITFALKAELQDPVFGIVALAANRTYQKGPEMSALAIVILSDGKSRSTTAGNQEHREVFVLGLFHDALDRMP